MDLSPSDVLPDQDTGRDPPSSATEGAERATEDHAAAEGTDASSSSGMGSSRSLREMLLSTEPDTPLEQVESPWDPDAGGINRIYRAFQKMLDFSGLPAVVDLVVGVAEFVTAYEPEGDGGEGDDHDRADGDYVGGDVA